MQRVTEATVQYLARHAEPEARVADQVSETYSAALVLPAYAEEPSVLERLSADLRNAERHVLLTLVVNAPDTDPAHGEASETNQRLLHGARSLGRCTRLLRSPPIDWIRAATGDVLLVDRCHPGRRISAKQGVGLARKIGMDIALGLFSRGRLLSSVLFNTDADVELPSGYFHSAGFDPSCSAWLYPFHHVPSGDRRIDAATELHELWLRYYEAGLRWAGSPFAFQTIGSTLAVNASAYAAVRGFPKRAAGEDFHLLNKLAKVAPIQQLASPPIGIRSRRSARVPFGTGPRVNQLLKEQLREPHASDGGLQLYHPEVFAGLRMALDRLKQFSRSGRPESLGAPATASSELGAAVTRALNQLGAPAMLAQLYGQARDPLARLERFHGWFDALKTLRFLHLLRDTHAPSIPWRRALADADFIAQVFADGTSSYGTSAGSAGGKASAAHSTLVKMRAGVVNHLEGPSAVRVGRGA
jgi:hypothetical protein